MTITETTTRISAFYSTLVIRDDARGIRVDATGGGPEQVSIQFLMPNFDSPLAIYLTVAKATQLRDLLSAALDTVVTA